MNKLYQETSPYLLQHATNPVHWLAYNNSSLTLAKQTNKLIIISIGYSTCHWCHVMEHESFENREVADLMNQHFVSIKVDREEMPDIDAFYMKSVQLMTNQGGWPLNVVCLPDGRPIWGGTYFSKEKWCDALTQLSALYQSKPNTALEYAEQLHQGISVLSAAPSLVTENNFDFAPLLDKWKKSFDWEYGGYSRTPKFMMPTNLLFLQNYGLLKEDTSLLEYVDLTLTKMAWGGLFDTIEGGFSRYSVDDRWHIPHFEKMLYDNAQLLQVYADAYKRTQNTLYKEVIEKTIQFIETNWKNNYGGYYSAYDADSLNAKGQLVEGEFYVWTIDELEAIISTNFDIFSTLYNINSFGYWEDEKYVLIQNNSIEAIAKYYNKSTDEIHQLKQKWEQELLTYRIKRKHPRIDNKALLSWNAMYITGLLDSYTALSEPTYLTRAKTLFSFIQIHLMDNETQELYHNFINGNKTPIKAYFDDYAFFIQACIQLYECTAEESYLRIAKQQTDYCLDNFFDENAMFFFLNAKTQAYVTRIFETEDNVIPSSNAIMCINLLKLGVLFENNYYTKLAKTMNGTMCSQVDYPSAYSHWLLANLYIEHPQELTIVANDALELSLNLRKENITHSFIFPVQTESSIPYLSKYTINQTVNSQYYLCTNSTCLKPENNPSFLTNHKL
ncbi:thioredoxin domain-containing protein [Myroides pelagicus]|uniref:DUF255 domain-containing protein n=1 Tax=Myroides pelagicus TaxID=270914 RepID=A0A7K1GIV0_9FLAO|nr:thioredoxin domain-containing protein [Myroides pelagicus]MEC4112860.1 thioredoxin domain-containing protein [Myroides pelagicus]MTH28670.1 DUF255 domain-containing protein [Myroides pelagicus]